MQQDLFPADLFLNNKHFCDPIFQYEDNYISNFDNSFDYVSCPKDLCEIPLDIASKQSSFIDTQNPQPLGSKTNCFNIQRNFSCSSVQNQPVFENNYQIPYETHFSYPKPQCNIQLSVPEKERELNITNGFLDLTSKSSYHWAKKYSTKGPSTIQEEYRENEEIDTPPSTKLSATNSVFQYEQPAYSSDDTDIFLGSDDSPVCNKLYGDSYEEELDKLTAPIIKKAKKTVIPEAPKAWDSKSDKLLVKYAHDCNCSWKKVAKLFDDPSITTKFLKDRYKVLKESFPSKKTRFTHQEDLTIVKYYKVYGSNWEKISKFFKARTPSMIKNRFYSNIKKRGLVNAYLAEIQQIEKGQQEKCKTESFEGENFINSQVWDSSVGYDNYENDFQNEKEKQQTIYYNDQDLFKTCDQENRESEVENELVNHKLYGYSFDQTEDFLEYQRQNGFNFNNTNVELENAKGKSELLPQEFAKMQAKEKIELIRNKLSSIQHLFQETKLELEKIQHNYVETN